MKYLVAALIVAGTVSGASAMPAATSHQGETAGLPIIKAEVVVKKTVVRRPPVVRRRVVKKVIVR